MPRVLTRGDGSCEGLCHRHKRLLASSAPCDSDLNFAHTTVGWTSGVYVACDEKPQSLPAITFSGPARSAYRMMRSATTSGCSTTFVVWLITPGMIALP